jgi:capsid protein
MIELPYGEELMQTDPKFPLEASVHFKKDNLMEAATGVGQAYDAISGDYQNLGFSAARLSQQAPRQNYRRRQAHFKNSICRPEFREWLRSSIMAGVFDIPISRLEEIVNSAHFQGVRWESANPLQDVQATILEYESGFKSEQQIQDEMEDGQDLSSLYAQREEAKALQEKHGLNFEDEDVTKPTISKGEPAQTVPKANEASQPPPKTRPANPVRRGRGVSETTARFLQLQGDGRNGYHD